MLHTLTHHLAGSHGRAGSTRQPTGTLPIDHPSTAVHSTDKSLEQSRQLGREANISKKRRQLSEEESGRPEKRVQVLDSTKLKGILSLPPELFLEIFDRTRGPLHLCEWSCLRPTAKELKHCELLPWAGVCRQIEFAVNGWYRRQRLEINMVGGLTGGVGLWTGPLASPNNKKWLRNVSGVAVNLDITWVMFEGNDYIRRCVKNLCGLLDLRPNENWKDTRIEFILPTMPDKKHARFLPTELYKMFFQDAFWQLIDLGRMKLGQENGAENHQDRGTEHSEATDKGEKPKKIGHELAVSKKPLIWPSDATNTPAMMLHLSCSRGNNDLAKLILQEYGVPPDTVYENWTTPLWIAASKGKHEIVKMLLDAGKVNAVFVNRENNSPLRGYTPIEAATKNNRRKTVEIIDEHLRKSQAGKKERRGRKAGCRVVDVTVTCVL